MQRLFFKKFMTSIIFIIMLLSFAFYNFKVSYSPILNTLKQQKTSSTSLVNIIAAVEGTINDNTAGKYKFIELYGYIQKLMYKNEESNFEVVKDKNDFLHYTYFAEKPNPVYHLVERTKSLKAGLKDKRTKLIYMMPPDKYVEGYSKLPYGIPYSYSNETADVFLNLLKKNNIDTIDLRKNLTKSGIENNQLFFKTDHHWTIQTAFWEYTQLVNTLKTKYKLNIDEDGFYTNKDNYNFITYKNAAIGSMARKTGILYSGVDDFTLIYPKFATNYSYYSKTGNQVTNLNGRFEEALLTIDPLRTNKDIYSLEADKYSSYLFGNQGIVHVINKNNLNGPKVLFVKDSFTVPLAAFLSTVCSDVYLVDPRYYTGNIPNYINSVKTDFVFLSFYPQDLTKDFFKFYENK
ncbi:DHHW family protein [Clostridium hydrogenum]|uniref:DHHW family protein n=1 Tax=Clostridium hydrogenum TaxID=2855764 RepID=UPI001F3FBB8C|nr:DHHW family protein [Clostridium hydrogenum]